MNLELKLNYEEAGQDKVLALVLDVSSEKETAYCLSTTVGDINLSFRPAGVTIPAEMKTAEFGFSDFNQELKRKMEERKVFAPKHRSQK